jgi:branched-chain amino acid transport system permease protein
MLGAFFGLFAATQLGTVQNLDQGGTANVVSIALIFVVSMALCAVGGVLMERLAYRPLRSSPRLAVLITAIGVSMLLEYGGQVVFTPNPRSFPQLIPEQALIDLPTFTLSQIQVTIVVLALLMMVALQFIVLKTRLGRAMRAVSLDRAAASLMGINTDVIIAITFALGSALAAAGGILNGVYSQRIDPLMGLMAGLKAFVAAVLGGIGSIPGAMLGGLLLGFAETGVAAIPRGSQYKDAIAFAILILVLLLRPAGLLGRSAPEKV